MKIRVEFSCHERVNANSEGQWNIAWTDSNQKKKLKERNGEVLYVSNMEVHAYGKINIVFSLIFASSLTVAQICS